MIDQLPLPKVGDPIKAEHIAAISKALRKRTPLNSPSVKVREVADGFYLEAGGGGGLSTPPCSYNWKPRKINSELISVSAGQIMGTTVSSSGLAVHATDLNYVYARVAVTPVVTNAFVTSATFSGHTIVSSTSTLSDSETAGVYTRHFLLFTWQAGALVAQTIRFNIGIKVRGAETAPTFESYTAAS